MELTHINEKGQALMVDVSEKTPTKRVAVAVGKIFMDKKTIDAIVEGSVPKGDVLATARVAGIMAAKKTNELIPMCHGIAIEHAVVDIETEEDGLKITATVNCFAKTGIEMEALTAVSIAALTIYDMCKAIDKRMVISEIRLVKKTGGKSDLNLN